MNKKNVIYFLLIIIIISVYYFYKDNQYNDTSSTFIVANQPIYQSENMITSVYNLSGDISYKITATSVKYFVETDNTEFENPTMVIYQNGNSESWYIQAKDAILTKNQLLYLNHDVKLDNLVADGQLQHVATDNAVVDLTTQVVTSKDNVEIEGAIFHSKGRGFVANLKEKTAEILHNVVMYYNTKG